MFIDAYTIYTIVGTIAVAAIGGFVVMFEGVEWE